MFDHLDSNVIIILWYGLMIILLENDRKVKKVILFIFNIFYGRDVGLVFS